MKQFFKMVLATIVGFILSYIILLFIVIGVMVAVVASVTTEKKSVLKPNSVLHITLNYPIVERTAANPFQDFEWNTFRANKRPGLNDILSSIKKAGTDPSVSGIFLDISSLSAGIASIEEIRNALLDFKKQEKFIYAYSEFYTQSAYYLASVADKIYLNPEGSMDFKGLRTELMFFKGSFEKLDIEPQIIRHGKFKSFIEPFVLDKMSPENREQLSLLLGTIWYHYLEGISKDRKIPMNELQKKADNLLVRTADDARANGLVDSLTYMDGMLDVLRNKLGLKDNGKINLVKLSKYSGKDSIKKEYSKDKIAMIYAIGGISGGDGDDDNIGSDKLSETIRKARLDTNIKAIVLRVNSPGGSALASEVIWREMELARKAKPVVVSMGDVAASGGYYISCGADKIVAEPNTITGSIGVLGILFNTKKFLNNKLGITIDTVKTGKYADLGTPFRPMTESEKQIMQNMVEHTYAVFLKRVADGRKMKPEAVDAIGQGRIWSGWDAKQIGLVDEIGGIDKAVGIAARLAGIMNYKLVPLPEQKEPFRKLMEDLSDDAQTAILEKNIGAREYSYYKQLQSLKEYQGIQTRMPAVPDIY